MNDLHITTIQTKLHWENPDANRAMLEENMAGIIDSTDVIVLPEMFTTGFSMNAENLAEPMNFHTMKWMRAMASKNNALILGSAIIKENNKFYNRLIWMEPDGIFKTYDKRHLFRMADEDKSYAAGQSKLISEWRGWKICPLVCYDLRFPVFSRNTYDTTINSLAYDVLVYVANWPAARSNHWQTLLQARAIENLSYVVGVNRTGVDGNQNKYEGHSSVIDPMGIIIYDREQDEEVITHTLKADVLKNWREKFPAWRDADRFNIEL